MTSSLLSSRDSAVSWCKIHSLVNTLPNSSRTFTAAEGERGREGNAEEEEEGAQTPKIFFKRGRMLKEEKKPRILRG